MAIRRILTYPEPSLRNPSHEVTNITGDTVRWIDDMVQTMYAAPGVGLAAPQLGLDQRIIVVDVGEQEEDGTPGKNLVKLINPVIAESEGEILWEEGCLSVIDFRAEVKRAGHILVRGFDPEQREIQIEAEGLLAVALQHEIDHLEGRLFIDHVSRLKRDMYAKRVRKALREGKPIARSESASGEI